MAYDSGLVERVADAVAQVGHGTPVRQKNVFGGRGFLAGRSTFVIVSGTRLLVKVPPAEYADALAERGVNPFAPGGEAPMSTWVVVDEDAIADDPELTAWVERGLRALR